MKVKHMICDWDETIAHTLPTITNAYDAIADVLSIKRKSIAEIKTLTSNKPKSEVFQPAIIK